MKVQGRIKKLMAVQSGISRVGNKWRKQDFILEYFENPSDQYPDSVILSLMNDRIDEHNLEEGEEVVVEFIHQVKAYGDRIFNEVWCRSIEKVNRPQLQAKQTTAEGKAAQPTPEQQEAMERLKQMGETAASGDAGENGSELPF